MPTRSRPPKSSPPDPALIRTKLKPPAVRPSFVERPRLLERLDEALEHRVTLVSAPPGFGKTTLVAQWLARRQGTPCAWLSVDSFDSDAERFVRYLLAIVEGASTHRLPNTAALLAAPEQPAFSHRLEVLASEMAGLDSPLLLVLEDFHLAESEEVQQLVERLVETMSQSLHLVILTRRDPPWPLASWKTRGLARRAAGARPAVLRGRGEKLLQGWQSGAALGPHRRAAA